MSACRLPDLPLLPTLRGYQSSWLVPDLVAGVTLLAIAVPEQMATARLANLSAVTGLYAFIAGSVVFALVGINHHMSVGADSTIAPVFAAAVATVALPGTAAYTHLVGYVALAVGVVLILVGVLRLGWIADFLPIPVVIGVLAGIAVSIVVRQLPAVLGLPGGGTTTIGRLETAFDQRADVNAKAVVIAACVLVILIVAEKVDRRVPGALIGLAASTGVVAGFGWAAHGVGVVGSFHATVPAFGVPPVHFGDVGRLVGAVFTVAFLCIVQTSATARSGTADPDPGSELNRDLLALAAGNVVAGLSGSFPINVSPPRTTVVESVGGRTQLTSLFAAAGVVVVLFASGLFKDLPDATLGAILIFVASRLFRGGDLRQVMHFDHFEFSLALITILVVALVGIEQGVVVAIIVALGQRTRIAARPRDAVLGREPGTDHWVPTDLGRPTEQLPGVLVYLLYAPLWYGNARYVMARLRTLVHSMPVPARALILDADGISDVDYTATRLLGQLAADLHAQGVQIRVARTSHLVHHDLQHGLQDIGPEQMYSSVADAVADLANANAGPGPDPG